MRKTFADVLRSGGVDVRTEYESLYELVFEQYGLYSIMEQNFRKVPFAGTAISLKDFNSRENANYIYYVGSPNLDFLLGFCEYCYNFAVALEPRVSLKNSVHCKEVIKHINKLVDKLSYTLVDDGGVWILVAKDSNIMAAAEVAPEQIGFDLIKYDYRGYNGDLEGKKSILLCLIDYLEPKRRQLETLARGLTNDLFFIANNLNIRHNNTDPQDSGKYKTAVARMDNKEIEQWYDFCHELCAAAILLLGYDARHNEVEMLKERIAG